MRNFRAAPLDVEDRPEFETRPPFFLSCFSWRDGRTERRRRALPTGGRAYPLIPRPMTNYQIALSVHLLALLAATAASAIVHLAAARRAAAPSLGAAMEWGRLIGSTSRVFPIAVVTLVATGAYMVVGRWQWSAGWVTAGLCGAFLLLVSGAVVGRRGAAEARASIERLTQAGRDLPNDVPPDRVMALLAEANTGLALAIVLVMTMKPGLAASLAVLAIGAALGAYRAVARDDARATMPESSEIETA